MSSARPWCMSAGVWKAMPEWRCSSLYQRKNRPQKAWASSKEPNRSGKSFIDALHVKIRDGGAVGNRPIYTAVGVTVDGERDILGLWAGTGGEGAKFWLHVLTEIKNRGVADVCIVVCDGLTGLPDAIGATWPQALTQTCVLHLLRNSFRYASRKHWPAL